MVTDGPFAESKEQLGGYYLIDCENLDEALAWAEKVPLSGAGAIEVRPRDGLLRVRLPELDTRGEGGRVGAREEVVDRVFRHEAGRAVATLIRVLGDFDAAEEAVQEAFVVALERWPADGLPDNPGAWITRVARNRAIDRLRRERVLVAEAGAAATPRADPRRRQRPRDRRDRRATPAG